MRRAHAFLGLALVLLLLGFSFNANASNVPLYGGARAAKGSDCSSPEEQSASPSCDTFKTFGVHTLPDLQPAHFGRVYAAYGGIFIVLALLWGWGMDGTRPDRFDFIGMLICLLGMAVIMYWPRS